jgi:hypothetical protein
VIFRNAVRADLPALIALLADDVLGKSRDFAVVDDAYERAFAALDSDPCDARAGRVREPPGAAAKKASTASLAAGSAH